MNERLNERNQRNGRGCTKILTEPPAQAMSSQSQARVRARSNVLIFGPDWKRILKKTGDERPAESVQKRTRNIAGRAEEERKLAARQVHWIEKATLAPSHVEGVGGGGVVPSALSSLSSPLLLSFPLNWRTSRHVTSILLSYHICTETDFEIWPVVVFTLFDIRYSPFLKPGVCFSFSVFRFRFGELICLYFCFCLYFRSCVFM